MADMRRKVLSRNSKSDHLTIVNAFQVKWSTTLTQTFLSSPFAVWIDPILIYNSLTGQGWEEAKQRGARFERDFCWDNFLSANTLQVSLANYTSCGLRDKPVHDCLRLESSGQHSSFFFNNEFVLIFFFIFQMLHNMKGQFAEHLMHAGFVSSKDPKDPKSNVNSGNQKIFFLFFLINPAAIMCVVSMTCFL